MSCKISKWFKHKFLRLQEDIHEQRSQLYQNHDIRLNNGLYLQGMSSSLNYMATSNKVTYNRISRFEGDRRQSCVTSKRRGLHIVYSTCSTVQCSFVSHTLYYICRHMIFRLKFYCCSILTTLFMNSLPFNMIIFFLVEYFFIICFSLCYCFIWTSK